MKMTRTMMLMMLACAGLGAAQASAGGFLAPGGSPDTGLEKASAAFLAKDYQALTGTVRDLLASPTTDAVERRAALDLLGKAYAETHGRLPADWQLPAGVTNFKMKQSRKEEPDGVIFEFALQANTPAPDTVSQLQLVKYPGQTLLDLKAGIGEWSTDLEDGGGFSFDLYAGNRGEPLAEGLYLLEIDLKDGTRASGWFILSDLVSSASPNLKSPSVGESLVSGNPEVIWDDFRSPEYKSYETRNLAVTVTPLPGNANHWTPVWELWASDPERSRVVVGKDHEGTGEIELPNGKYWVMVTYFEKRMFGPVKLERGSRTGRDFFVKKAQ